MVEHSPKILASEEKSTTTVTVDGRFIRRINHLCRSPYDLGEIRRDPNLNKIFPRFILK